jgi:hypothetical protein
VSDLVSRTSAESGFLDVAANALAIVILATMMLLLLSAPMATTGEPPPIDDPPEIARQPLPDPNARPYRRIYYVAEDKAVRLDFGALAAAALDGAPTDQGRLDLRTVRVMRRDVDEYRATFRPDHAALKAAAEPLEGESLARLVDRVRDAHEASRASAALLVYPDGVAGGGRLFWALRAADVPVRAYFASYGAGVALERRASSFEKPGALD